MIGFGYTMAMSHKMHRPFAAHLELLHRLSPIKPNNPNGNERCTYVGDRGYEPQNATCIYRFSVLTFQLRLRSCCLGRFKTAFMVSIVLIIVVSSSSRPGKLYTPGGQGDRTSRDTAVSFGPSWIIFSLFRQCSSGRSPAPVIAAAAAKRGGI